MSASCEAPAPIVALDARYYTDPDVYHRVRDRIFFTTWQFACHESAVSEPGAYVSFSICGENLFVVRGNDGSVRGFYNVCQHRAHPIVEGQGRSRVMSCPYHAWTYELDGRLRAAPGTKGLSCFDRDAIRLTDVRTEVFCGFVFVNLDQHARPMAEEFAEVEGAIRKLCPDIEARVFAHEHATREFCNWLIAVENYNECYHCKIVHPTFASGVIDPQSYNIRAAFTDARCLHHTAKPQCGASAWYDTSGSDYGSFYLWPAFSLQIYPSGLVNTYHWRPLSVDDTRVHRGWYSSDGEVDDTLQKVIDLDRDTTFAEDLELVRRVQGGLRSRGYRPGPLVVNPAEGIDSEHSIATLHTWMRAALP